MSKKFHLLMVVVLVTGLMGGLMTASTVSADPTPGCVIEIPRIDLGDVFDTGTADEWDTKIQVQNVGGVDAGAIAFFWPEWDGTCPSNDPGPMGHACMQLPDNGVWTLHSQIPDGAESAIVYSVDQAIFQQCCVDAGKAEGDTEKWKTWKLKCACSGPDLAVTVDRWGSDPYDEFMISSSYTGVTDPDMVGVGYDYFAPYVMHNYHDLDTTITIQNSGQWCTSCWIHYKQQGNCEYEVSQHVEAIAPGQAIRIGPGADADMNFPTPEVGSGWLGSAYITCNEDMAIIIDQLSHPDSTNLGTLLSMRGMPYVPAQAEVNRKQWFADLLFREISGWDSSIQVQNMTQSSMPTFVTVEFFDQSGDHILYLGDWVCRNGTATFYLPAIIDLGVNYPFGYLGAAEIQSHAQVDYPGGAHDGEDIVVVVDLKKRKLWRESINDWDHTMPGETQGGAYNAHPWDQKVNAWGWAMPFIAKKGEGVTSQIVVRNNSNCTKIKGTIYVKDETGTQVAYIPVGWLQPKHMSRFDLNYLGMVYPGFVGAGEFLVEDVEQLCDTNGDGETDIEPIMPSVVVLNYGWDKELPSGGAGPIVGSTEGDLARVYEAIPFDFGYSPCEVEICGQAIQVEDLDPVKNVTFEVLFEGENSPYTLAGFAYVDAQTAECETYDVDGPGKPRIEGAYVELQQWKTPPAVTVAGWYKVGSTTTSSAGWFQFKDALTWGKTYRAKIFIEEGSNTVSYVLDLDGWTAQGDATAMFHINMVTGEFDFATGVWCGFNETKDTVPLDINLAPADIYSATANPLKTDSTGHFCFTYGDGAWVWDATEVPPMWVWDPDAEPKTTDPEDIHLLAHKSGYVDLPLTLEDVACEDQYAYFEMDLIASDISVSGSVYDKETGLPINGAVATLKRAGTTLSTQEANGSYSFTEIPFDLYNPLTVCVDKHEGGGDSGHQEYTEVCDSVWIPKGGSAVMDFQLHCVPDSRVLLYYGNGGATKTSAYKYNDLAAEYAKDYIVEYTDVWPNDPDLGCYKMVVLLLPGLVDDDLPDNGFTEAQVTQMGHLIADGGRVVLITDNNDAFVGAQDFEVQNDLLYRLGMSINVTDSFTTTITYDEAIPGTADAYDKEFTAQHLEGDGFAELTWTVGDPWQMYVNRYGTVVVAGDKVGTPNVPDEDVSTGYDVIVISDAEILEDDKLPTGWPENLDFAKNLISFITLYP